MPWGVSGIWNKDRKRRKAGEIYEELRLKINDKNITSFVWTKNFQAHGLKKRIRGKSHSNWDKIGQKLTLC